jgi:hypothetical protein
MEAGESFQLTTVGLIFDNKSKSRACDVSGRQVRT